MRLLCLFGKAPARAAARRFAPRAALLGLLLAACARAPDALEDVNVLLILIDTLGAEYVGYVQPEGSGTPVLDDLARNGIAFRQAYSPAPWTQPAVASLYTAKLPSSHGVQRLFDVLQPRERTLAELLEERGFVTGGVISHELLGARLGFAQGFRDYDESPVGGHEAITSERVTDAAIRWLARRGPDTRFFLLAHYFDPHFAYHHHPAFDRTRGYRGRLAPGMDIWALRDQRDRLDADDLAYLVGLYREEIAYTDAHVGRLLAYLRERGLLERTLVIVAADHGEEFMRHGWIGHTRTLYDELLRVPLIFSLPGRLTPRSVDEPVSLLDVLPTLLAWSRQPEDASDRQGVSLLPTLLEGVPPPSPRDLFAEVSFAPRAGDPGFIAQKTAFKTALLRGPLKLVHDLLDDRFALYDRALDPDELQPLPDDAPARAELEARLRAWETSRADRPQGESLQPTPEEEARLRALGYLR